MGDFSLEPNRAPKIETDFRKTIAELGRTRGGGHLEVFNDFCRMVACALACETREEEYLTVAKRYQRDELSKVSQAMAGLVNEMEANPFEDILGPYYTEINSSATARSRGEYYTPPALSKVLSELLFTDDQLANHIEKGKPIMVHEPACGSGGMILSLAELFAPKKAVDLLRVTMIDVSPAACDMAYINTTLWGIPANIIQGNCLTLKFEKSFKNINWVRVGEDNRQATLRMINLSRELFSPSKKAEQEPPSENFEKPNISFPVVKTALDGEGQFQLDLDF